MKQALFLIGTSVTRDVILRGYILRHLDAAGIVPDIIFSPQTSAAALPPIPLLDSGIRRAFIFCDPGQAALVARELCTLAGDVITARNEVIIPADATVIRTGYYTMEIRNVQLHVLTAYTGHILPELKLDGTPRKEAVVHLLDVDRETLGRLLGQLETAFRVGTSVVEPVTGWMQCRLRSDRFGDIIGAQAHLVSHFQTVFQAEDIAEWMIETLEAEKKSVTFAESCTGGLLSSYLTRASGASGVFEGALVTYSNRLKSSWIAVDKTLLEKYGAVSRPVVEAMSEGALQVAGADYAIATSGIAGPTGGTPDKPVGTVFVAVRSKNALHTGRLQLHGDRNYIQEQTVLHALKMLLLLDKKTFFKIS